jgi:hypothetical protein
MNIRVLDLEIIRSRNLRSGFRTEVYESHCEETFEKRHVLEKTLKELSLKHLYISVSLLNDISRSVQNIDYTRDMS